MERIEKIFDVDTLVIYEVIDGDIFEVPEIDKEILEQMKEKLKG